MAESNPEMARAGVEFAAEEHHDDAKLQAKVDAAAGGPEKETPATGGATPAAAAAPAAPVALPDEATQKLCKTIVLVLDRLVVNFTVPELKLTGDEVDQVAVAAVPVLNKHLPDIIKTLAGTVEGQFILTLALIYASKAPDIFFAPPKPQLPAPVVVPPAAPAEGVKA